MESPETVPFEPHDMTALDGVPTNAVTEILRQMERKRRQARDLHASRPPMKTLTDNSHKLFHLLVDLCQLCSMCISEHGFLTGDTSETSHHVLDALEEYSKLVRELSNRNDFVGTIKVKDDASHIVFDIPLEMKRFIDRTADRIAFFEMEVKERERTRNEVAELVGA